MTVDDIKAQEGHTQGFKKFLLFGSKFISDRNFMTEKFLWNFVPLKKELLQPYAQ